MMKLNLQSLCRLVDDMIETLDDAGGIGLAAPQVNDQCASRYFEHA